MGNYTSQKVAKNTLYMFIRMILVLLVGLYTSRIILEVLGFEDFGIYNVVGSVVIFLNFLKMALNNATYRYITYEIGAGDACKISEVYTMAIKSHVILAIIMILFMELGGVYFLNHNLNIASNRMFAANILLQLCIFSFAIDIINTPFNSNIIAHEEMNFFAKVSVIEVFLKLMIVFAIKEIPYDKLITYGFLQVIVSLIVSSFYIFFCIKSFKECKILCSFWDKKLAKEFCSYSGWSLIVNAADVIAYQCMSFFFNIFIGVIANAALGVSNQVTSQAGRFLGSFTQAYQPQIIKSYAAKDYNYFYNLLLSSSKISFFLMLIICVPLIVNINFILKMWLGSYPEMAPLLIILFLIYSLVEATQTPLVNAVHATGNIRTHQLLMSSLKIIGILFMYIIISNTRNGYYMIIVWLLFHFIWSAVRDVYLVKLINFPLRKFVVEVVWKLLIITFLSLPLPLIIVNNMGCNLSAFLLSSFISLLIMFLLIWNYGLEYKERQLILGLGVVKKLKKRFL